MKQNISLGIGFVILAAAVALVTACAGPDSSHTKIIQSHREKDLLVSLVNENGELGQGQNQFTVWFQTPDQREFVDVGAVTVSSSMSMPGMAPMTAPIELEKATEKGKYIAKGDFPMSGAWQFELRWDGPAGQGMTSFNTSVR
jgi:hypothetical protein